jgi:xyloglucan-specific endo-beta-1,4-glucanase
MKVYSFLPPQGTTYTSFNADIKNFFNYLVQNQGFPESNQNLIGMRDPFIAVIPVCEYADVLD